MMDVEFTIAFSIDDDEWIRSSMRRQRLTTDAVEKLLEDSIIDTFTAEHLNVGNLNINPR